jgi:hypothetical protein
MLVIGHDGLTPLTKLAILEPPYRDNANGHGDFTKASCIMCGRYRVTPMDHAKLGFCLLVHDVPGRSEILIHWGGKPENSLGCLCFGMEFKGYQCFKQTEARRKLQALFVGQTEAVLIIVDAA